MPKKQKPTGTSSGNKAEAATKQPKGRGRPPGSRDKTQRTLRKPPRKQSPDVALDPAHAALSASAVLRKHASQAASLLKLLASPMRLTLLCYMLEGDKSVSEIGKALHVTQSSLSQHLTKLRRHHIVNSVRRGQMAYYRIASVEVQAIISVLHLLYHRT